MLAAPFQRCGVWPREQLALAWDDPREHPARRADAASQTEASVTLLLLATLGGCPHVGGSGSATEALGPRPKAMVRAGLPAREAVG
jgi:hypothetical protein